jgi:uncharacterized iron-regulated membrane protein
MKYRLTILNRKVHYWLSIAVILPFSVVVCTGIILLLKKDVAWIQPPTLKGTGKSPTLSFDSVLAVCRRVPEASVQSWSDITRIDVQPSKGVMKVQTKSLWEIQLDIQSARVLHVAYRRSDVIESLHDGTFFHELAKYVVFLPSALCVLALLITGIVLFFHPLLVRFKRRRTKTITTTSSSVHH